jgi:hypothetical protein
VPATLGPSRWKRLLYSILSVPLGVLIASFALSFGISLWEMRPFDLKATFEATLLFSYGALFFCVPGWLLSLSLVLTITNLSRWRFFAVWVIGTAIGPIVLLAISLLPLLMSHHAVFLSDKSLISFAVVVACLVTLIYLLLVRFDQRRAHSRQTNNVAQSDPTTHIS